MNHPWAMRFDTGSVSTLAGLRLVPGIEFAISGSDLWLRSSKATPDLEVSLKGCPALERFEWVPPESLRPLQRLIPSHRLPKLEWRPTQELFQVHLPPAALAAARPRRLPFVFVRDDREMEPSLLSVPFRSLFDWATTAPRIRLDRLRFAARAPDFSLVWGTPLPPISGTHFVVREHLATPSGWRWDPAIEPEACRRWLGVGKDSMLLFDSEGAFSRIHLEQFVPLTPSALRRTRQSLEASTGLPKSEVRA